MNFNKIQETVEFIRSQVNFSPTVGIVAGSGLGDLSAAIDHAVTLSYDRIPHFPKSTVAGHAGKLIFGNMQQRPVVLMAGRFHYYEGYSMQEVTFPIRVMKGLGVDTLFLSNAAGAMNPNFQIGDIMLLKDHINLFPEHPLRGSNDDRLGVRFPDMSVPYDPALLKQAQQIAAEEEITVHSGTYVGLQGPCFETPAEYRWLRTIGGDAVGMSTVPEVIVARHGNMKVFAASIITDIGCAEQAEKITHEEVLAAAEAATPKLSLIVNRLLSDDQ